MSEPKWVVLSKSAWATVSALLAALVSAKPELTGLDTLANGVFAGSLVIVSVVLEYLNQRKRGNTVLPAPLP